MEIRSYNKELALANLMFLRIFNNIRIDKPMPNGTVKEIKVNCVFGNRSRIIKGLENPDRRATYKLPIICINRTGYSRQGDRLNNIHNEVKYEITSSNRLYDIITPVPIDISYDVIIISKDPADIDMIASNFMVFFNPDVYVSCEHPKYKGIKLNNQVIISDSVTEDHPDELDGTADDIITSTFNFTFKTYLFGGSRQAASSDGVYDGFMPVIKNINFGWYPVPTVSSDYVQHFSNVDSYPSNPLSSLPVGYSELSDIQPIAMSDQWQYVDRIVWKLQ